jgi:hypothetical protein
MTTQRTYAAAALAGFVVARHRAPSAKTDLICEGSLLTPLQTPVQKRRYQRRVDLIEPFRAHAAVALDAWIEHHPYPELDIEILCQVACWWYQACHAQMKPLEVVRYVARRTRAGGRGTNGDLYCSFCGVILAQRIHGERFGTISAIRLRQLARVSGHAIECALLHLAHAKVPSTPNVRKLPDEAQPVNAEELP